MKWVFKCAHKTVAGNENKDGKVGAKGGAVGEQRGREKVDGCLGRLGEVYCSAHCLCVDLVMDNHTCNLVCMLLLPCYCSMM